MTRTKINEQKEYLCGTALQRVGGGEIPAGKYKGNGFVRCKANVKCKSASSGCRVLTLQGKDIEEIPYRIEVVRKQQNSCKKIAQ